MIIFIDGPNGSGKDYTIDKLKWASAASKLSFSTIGFKEVIKEPELRQSVYARKEETLSSEAIDAIYNNHLRYIAAIKERQNNNDVVVVNRFVPSYYAYQYRLPERAEDAVDLDEVKRLIKVYINSFYFYDVRHVMLQDEAEVHISRFLTREKTVDFDKHMKLHQYYTDFNNTLAKMLPDLLVTSSLNINPVDLLKGVS